MKIGIKKKYLDFWIEYKIDDYIYIYIFGFLIKVFEKSFKSLYGYMY